MKLLDFRQHKDHPEVMPIYLSEEQKQPLINPHRICRERHICNRINCVLLSADGWSPDMIPRSSLLHETTVLRRLNEAQTAELTTLTANLLPITQAIVSIIDNLWGIRCAVPGIINKWLYKHGVSYRKPVGIA